MVIAFLNVSEANCYMEFQVQVQVLPVIFKRGQIILQMDRYSVEVGKAKKCLQFSISSQYGPVLNTSYLYKIYLNLILGNNQT